MCVKYEITLEASEDNLDEILDFLDEKLKGTDCPLPAKRQIDIAAEEIFINISSYAYRPGTGDVTLGLELSRDPAQITITFIDEGVPFDPLAKEDPDIDLPAKERQVGGLGILVVKDFMDDVTYEYSEGRNILTLKKAI